MTNKSEMILRDIEIQFPWWAAHFRSNIANDFWTEETFLNKLLVKRRSLEKLSKIDGELTGKEEKLLHYLETKNL